MPASPRSRATWAISPRRSRPSADATSVKHGVVVVATGADRAEAADATATARATRVLTQLELSDRLGRGDLDAAREGHRRDDPVRGAAERRSGPIAAASAAPRRSRTPCSCARRYPAGADRGPLPRHADLRVPRGGLPRGPREGRPVRPLRARSSRRNWTSTGACSCGSASRRWGGTCELEPDLVVLAAPMVPRADRQELSELLRVPLNADGFFLEAHMKLRPGGFRQRGAVPLRHGPRPEVHQRDDRPGQRGGRPGGLDPRRGRRCRWAARSPGSIPTSASPA